MSIPNSLIMAIRGLLPAILIISYWKTIIRFSFNVCLVAAVQCKEPPKVVGASVMESTNGFLYEAQVHYMCRQGYQMQGSATLTCGPNGEWIGETPNCKGMFQGLS